jgi:hypothetical protein
MRNELRRALRANGVVIRGYALRGAMLTGPGAGHGCRKTSGRLLVCRCRSGGRCAYRENCRSRAARAGQERSGPSLGLKLALVVRQHRAPRAVGRVARLFVFARGLGRSYACEDDKTERCERNAHGQSSMLADHRPGPIRTERSDTRKVLKTGQPIVAAESHCRLPQRTAHYRRAPYFAFWPLERSLKGLNPRRQITIAGRDQRLQGARASLKRACRDNEGA